MEEIEINKSIKPNDNIYVFFLNRMILVHILILAYVLTLWPLPTSCRPQLYLSPTQHANSGIYSIVLKGSAPPSSRDVLIRSIQLTSQENEFKVISKSHRVHLGFTARIAPELVQNVRVSLNNFIFILLNIFLF